MFQRRAAAKSARASVGAVCGAPRRGRAEDCVG